MFLSFFFGVVCGGRLNRIIGLAKLTNPPTTPRAATPHSPRTHEPLLPPSLQEKRKTRIREYKPSTLRSPPSSCQGQQSKQPNNARVPLPPSLLLPPPSRSITLLWNLKLHLMGLHSLLQRKAGLQVPVQLRHLLDRRQHLRVHRLLVLLPRRPARAARRPRRRSSATPRPPPRRRR